MFPARLGWLDGIHVAVEYRYMCDTNHKALFKLQTCNCCLDVLVQQPPLTNAFNAIWDIHWILSSHFLTTVFGTCALSCVSAFLHYRSRLHLHIRTIQSDNVGLISTLAIACASNAIQVCICVLQSPHQNIRKCTGAHACILRCEWQYRGTPGQDARLTTRLMHSTGM